MWSTPNPSTNWFYCSSPLASHYLIVTGFHDVHGSGMSFCNSADRYVSVAAGTGRECRPLSGLYENKKCMLAPWICLSIILTCPSNVSNLKCVIKTADSNVIKLLWSWQSMNVWWYMWVDSVSWLKQSPVTCLLPFVTYEGGQNQARPTGVRPLC